MLKIKIVPDDPEYVRKTEMVSLLENVYSGNDDRSKYLVDLSGMPALDERMLKEFNDATLVVSPEEFSKLKDRENILAAYPWRHWSVIYSLRQYIITGDAGDLVSFRIIINLPRKASRGEQYFYNRFLPEIIDLGCYIACAGVQEIHINRVEKQNICFVLVKFANKIVAEIELNEVIPDCLDPIRFVKAHFTEGVFTNMPLGGDLNVEGSLIVTGDSVERFVHEHMEHDRGDELGNFYFRMLYDIVNELYVPERYTDFRVIQKTVRHCLESNLLGTVKEIIR